MIDVTIVEVSLYGFYVVFTVSLIGLSEALLTLVKDYRFDLFFEFIMRFQLPDLFGNLIPHNWCHDSKVFFCNFQPCRWGVKQSSHCIPSMDLMYFVHLM